MYIFRNFTAAARKSHSRASSEGGAQYVCVLCVCVMYAYHSCHSAKGLCSIQPHKQTLLVDQLFPFGYLHLPRSLTPSAKKPRVANPLPSKQPQTSSLATHFTAASRQQKGKQRRSSEGILSETSLKPNSHLDQDSLVVPEGQPVGLAVDAWSDSTHHKAAPEMGMPLVSLAGEQQSCGEIAAFALQVALRTYMYKYLLPHKLQTPLLPH